MTDKARTGQAPCLSDSELICIHISMWVQIRTATHPERGRNGPRDFPWTPAELAHLGSLLSAKWLSFPSPLVWGRKWGILNKCTRAEVWQKCKTLGFGRSSCLLLWICPDNCKWLHSCTFNEIPVISWYTLTDGLHVPSALQMQSVAALKMIQACFAFQRQRAGSAHALSWLGSADEP